MRYPGNELATVSMLVGMGLAGGLHCAGMCGPLALLATAGGRRIPGLALYLTGKAASYVFLGTLAGALGEALLRAAPFGWGSRILALGAGLLLVAAALDSLGWLGGRLKAPSLLLTRLARESGLAGKLLLGAANGLLPCPMTYGFLALAAATGSPIGGAATMAILGVTSSLPLAVCALAGHRLAGLRFLRLPPLAALLALAAGCLVLYRGLVGSAPAAHGH